MVDITKVLAAYRAERKEGLWRLKMYRELVQERGSAFKPCIVEGRKFLARLRKAYWTPERTAEWCNSQRQPFLRITTSPASTNDMSECVWCGQGQADGARLTQYHIERKGVADAAPTLACSEICFHEFWMDE